MEPLATPAELVVYSPDLQIPETRARMLLAQASALVRGYCGWHLAPQIREPVRVDGSGAQLQPLPTLHLVEIERVVENGNSIALSRIRWSVAGFLLHRHRPWTLVLRGITATIVHGHIHTPPDVQAVVLAMAARVAAAPVGGGVQSERTGPFQVTWNTTAQAGGMMLLDHEQRVLDRHSLPDRP